MPIKKGTLDVLLSGRDPKGGVFKDGLFDELKKALAERALNAELDDHLDGQAAAGKANHQWLFEEDGADPECQSVPEGSGMLDVTATFGFLAAPNGALTPRHRRCPRRTAKSALQRELHP